MQTRHFVVTVQTTFCNIPEYYIHESEDIYCMTDKLVSQERSIAKECTVDTQNTTQSPNDISLLNFEVSIRRQRADHQRETYFLLDGLSFILCDHLKHISGRHPSTKSEHNVRGQ